MRNPHAGRHELGQNFLTDRPTIDRIVSLVERTSGPIVEIGPGDGALTLPLERLDRDLVAVDIDARRVRRLAERIGPRTRVVHRDFLRYRLPAGPVVLVGNLPYHLTTALLRRMLTTPHWSDAVLLVQWEVARRRAGVGGTSLMTVQSAPWFEFALDRRVPARCFSPRPAVDGGLLIVRRRPEPLLSPAERGSFRDFAHGVFTGRGKGMAQIVARSRSGVPVREVSRWLGSRGLSPAALPRDLSTADWVALFGAFGQRGEGERERSPGRGPRR